jgi:hypothetical protein
MESIWKGQSPNYDPDSDLEVELDFDFMLRLAFHGTTK